MTLSVSLIGSTVIPGERTSPRSSQAGFSLIELLVTIAILGIIMGPMVSAYVFAMQTSIDAQRRSKAVMLANWKVEQLRAEKGFSGLETGTTDKSSCSLPAPYNSSDKGIEYNCEIIVEEVSGTDPNFAAKKVEIKIFYDSVVTGNERTITCGDASDCNAADYATYLSKLEKD